MNRRSQPDEDAVTVHVTPRGGLYVKPAELLRSKAAQATIAKMDRVLRADSPNQQGTKTFPPRSTNTCDLGAQSEPEA